MMGEMIVCSMAVTFSSTICSQFHTHRAVCGALVVYMVEFTVTLPPVADATGWSTKCIKMVLGSHVGPTVVASICLLKQMGYKTPYTRQRLVPLLAPAQVLGCAHPCVLPVSSPLSLLFPSLAAGRWRRLNSKKKNLRPQAARLKRLGQQTVAGCTALYRNAGGWCCWKQKSSRKHVSVKMMEYT